MSSRPIDPPSRPSLLERLRAALRNLFHSFLWRRRRDPLAERGETFVAIDIDQAKHQLNLVSDARRYGERDLPRTDDASPDGPHERIRHYVNEEVADAFRLANRERERLTGALLARSVSELMARAQRLPSAVAAKVAEEARQAAHHLATLTAQREELRDRLQAYRERYTVRRSPELIEPHERKFLVAATMGLALGQAFANGILFSQGMLYGVSAGVALAMVLGVLDIGLHFALGRVATRVHGHQVYDRLLGGVFLLLVATSVAGYNLGLVHLRLNIRLHGLNEGLEGWLASMRDNLFGFTDFWSYALLVVGVLCSTLAVASAWRWDDPIPEYRKLGRKLRDLDGSIGYWQERMTWLEQQAITEGQEQLDEIARSMEYNVQVCEALLHRMTRLKENLESFLADASRAYAALVRYYRDENQLARNHSPPTYFSQPPHLDIQEPLHIDLTTISDFVRKQRKVQRAFASSKVDFRSTIRRALSEGMAEEGRR